MALSKQYEACGFFVYLITRTPQLETKISSAHKILVVDIDSPESLARTLSLLLIDFSEHVYSNLYFHILYGGGFGLGNDPEVDYLESATKVLHHNCTVPLYITTFLVHHFNKASFNSSLIHFVYYFSAVTEHSKASPIYVAAKSGLEGMMKAFVYQQHSNIYFSAFRLGVVPIDYKYFGRLKKKDISKFNLKLKENIPSLYSPEVEELSTFICNTLANSKLCNAMICDISGGNSWI